MLRDMKVKRSAASVSQSQPCTVEVTYSIRAWASARSWTSVARVSATLRLARAEHRWAVRTHPATAETAIARLPIQAAQTLQAFQVMSSKEPIQVIAAGDRTAARIPILVLSIL